MNRDQLCYSLDTLLESLSPMRIGETIEQHIGAAIDQYLLGQPPRITEWKAFEAFIADFVRFLENRILHAPAGFTVGREFDLDIALKRLRRSYGSSGEKAAFELARTGVEGGTRTVLKKLADTMRKEYEDKEVKGRIDHWWRSLDVNGQVEVSSIYVERYSKQFWPPEMTEGGGARLRMDFPKTLYQHYRSLCDLRRVYR